MTSRRVAPTRHGDFKIRLPEEERRFLRTMAPEIRELLGSSDDPAVARLFPVAYPHDEDRQTEYRLLVQSELLESHAAALSTFADTIDAERVDEEALSAWMRALNQIRLVLGTRLEVSEEGYERPVDVEDPRGPAFALYDYLTELQGEVIEALGGDRY